MLTCLYPPGAIASGHVERLNKHSYLAVLKISPGEDKHDSIELHAIDAHHARNRAEAICEKLGILLELTISQEIKAACYDDLTDIQADSRQQVKPAFFRGRRVV